MSRRVLSWSAVGLGTIAAVWALSGAGREPVGLSSHAAAALPSANAQQLQPATQNATAAAPLPAAPAAEAANAVEPALEPKTADKGGVVRAAAVTEKAPTRKVAARPAPVAKTAPKANVVRTLTAQATRATSAAPGRGKRVDREF